MPRISYERTDEQHTLRYSHLFRVAQSVHYHTKCHALAHICYSDGHLFVKERVTHDSTKPPLI